MSRVRSTRFLFSLYLTISSAAAVAFVTLPTQRPVESTSTSDPSSGAPLGTQGDRALTNHEKRRPNDSQRKSADAAPSPDERQSIQRQGDSAMPSPDTQEEEDDPDLPGFLRGRVKINKEEYLRQ